MADGARVGEQHWIDLVRSEKAKGGDIDAQLASINVCFSTTNHLLSRTIRTFTCSPVSHAVITFRSRTLNRVMVMQASGHGYQIVPWSRWAQQNILVARFRLLVDEDDQLLALRAMARRLGDGYDRRGLLGFLPLLWFRLVDWIRSRWRVQRQGRGPDTASWRPRFHNWLDNPNRLFCSEAVAEFLSYAGFAEEFEHPSDWSPENLLEFARAEDERAGGRFEQISNDDNQEQTRLQQLRLPTRIWQRAKIAPPSETPPPPAQHSAAA